MVGAIPDNHLFFIVGYKRTPTNEICQQNRNGEGFNFFIMKKGITYEGLRLKTIECKKV